MPIISIRQQSKRFPCPKCEMIFTDKKIADHHFNALHKNAEIENKANMEETLDIDSDDDDIISLDSIEENENNPKNEFEKAGIDLTQDEKSNINSRNQQSKQFFKQNENKNKEKMEPKKVESIKTPIGLTQEALDIFRESYLNLHEKTNSEANAKMSPSVPLKLENYENGVNKDLEFSQFSCPKCFAEFSQKQSRDRHLKTCKVYNKENDKNIVKPTENIVQQIQFSCPKCYIEFRYEGTMRRHLRTCTAENTEYDETLNKSKENIEVNLTDFLLQSNLFQTFATLPNFQENNLESNIESENIQMNFIQGEEENIEHEEKMPEFSEDENLLNQDLNIESYLSIGK